MLRTHVILLSLLSISSTVYAGALEDLQKIVAIQQSQLSSIHTALKEMLLMTTSSKCPGGWSEYTAANGRFIVGTAGAGQAAVTRGSPMTDQGKLLLTNVPAHSHRVNPPATQTADSGSHSHGTGDPGLKYFWTASSSLGLGAVAKGNGTGWDGNNIARSTTGDAGTHSHSVDIIEFDSGSTGITDGVDITPPYIQVRICRLNGG